MTESKGTREGYPTRPEHVVWKVVDGKGILLNLETGAYFETNPAGLAIWQQCDGRTSSGRIVEGLVGTFRVSAERVHRDVRTFLGDLRRRKMITVTSIPVRAR